MVLSFLRLAHVVRWIKMGAGGALIPVYPSFLAPVHGSSFDLTCVWHLPSLCLETADFQ